MSNDTVSRLIDLVRSVYRTDDFVPLHAPTLGAIEKSWVCEAIDSSFVSTAGKFVGQFESCVANFAGCENAVSTVNGTAALHACLFHAGVSQDNLVITQSMTFVATCNAIHHLGAQPVFVDIAKKTLGMCEISLADFLDHQCVVDDGGQCIHRGTGKLVKAIVPMHTFGHPVNISAIVEVANRYELPVIEDAAESLGSWFNGQHTGTFGRYGVMSFNGNKIVTTGGGGTVLCASEQDARDLMHLTTTAKIPHAYEFFHDKPGFNYRMPNLNAAMGLAQMSRLSGFLDSKRRLAAEYMEFFKDTEFEFFIEPENTRSNYWLNAVVCSDFDAREALLKRTNAIGVMTRPVWTLMHRLPTFAGAIRVDLSNSEWAESRVVNIPSSPIL